MKLQPNNSFQPLSQVFEHLAVPELYKSNESPSKFFTGYRRFDELTSGFQAGELVVVGGRPGMGKTQFLLNHLINLGPKENRKAAFITLEDDLISTGIRLKSIITGAPLDRLQANEEKTAELDASVKDEMDQLDSSVFFMEAGGVDFDRIVKQVKEIIEKEDIQILFIDNLQRLFLPGKQTSREQELSYIVQELKNLAKDKQILVLVSSQIHRWVELKGGNKRPLLSDLLGSEEIECVADKVVFLYQPEYYGIEEDENGLIPDGLTYVKIAKNRHGNTGECMLLYQRDNGRFVEKENIVFKKPQPFY
jgi:replicative DNA helicase